MENGIINKKNGDNKIFWRQLLICSIVSLFDILTGVTTSAPTMIIAQFRNEANSTKAVTDDIASWASSIGNLAGIFWVIILITMAHFIGRKKTLLCIVTFTLFTLINVYYTRNMIWLVINQALLGINNAGNRTLFIMLVNEYSSLQFRPIFLTFTVASFLWGVWISNALGTYFHWTSIALFGIACTIYITVALFKIPESPYWLARNGKYEECTLNHRWLKGITENAEKELVTLITSETRRKDKYENEDKALKSSNAIGLRYLKMLLKPEIYKPVFYCNLLLLINIFSCKFVLVIYAIDILKNMTGSEEAAYKWMLILDGVTVLGMYLAGVLNKITTRKRLLLLGSSVAVLLLCSLSFYLFLVKFAIVSNNVHVTMTLLVLYSISVCCGPITTTAVLIGELLPVTNSMSLLITAVCSKLLIGIMLKTSIHIFKLVGNHWAFFIYALGLIVVLICVKMFVPETNNKTINEIADSFKSNRTKESEIDQHDVLLPKIN